MKTSQHIEHRKQLEMVQGLVNFLCNSILSFIYQQYLLQIKMLIRSKFIVGLCTRIFCSARIHSPLSTDPKLKEKEGVSIQKNTQNVQKVQIRGDEQNNKHKPKPQNRIGLKIFGYFLMASFSICGYYAFMYLLDPYLKKTLSIIYLLSGHYFTSSRTEKQNIIFLNEVEDYIYRYSTQLNFPTLMELMVRYCIRQIFDHPQDSKPINRKILGIILCLARLQDYINESKKINQQQSPIQEIVEEYLIIFQKKNVQVDAQNEKSMKQLMNFCITYGSIRLIKKILHIMNQNYQVQKTIVKDSSNSRLIRGKIHEKRDTIRLRKSQIKQKANQYERKQLLQSGIAQDQNSIGQVQCIVRNPKKQQSRCALI